MQQFLLFGPDLPPATPGVLLDVADMLPTARGYRSRPGAVNAGYSALPSAANSLVVLTDLTGARRIFAGTETALFETQGGVLEDVSAAGGYSIGAGRWQFAQFGNTALAIAKAAVLQASTSGDFAAVSGAPKASLLDTSGGFVMLADTNDSTYGDQADRWWCSAYLDYATWTPAVSTQCVTGRLVDSPGPIMALKALGTGFVAYKAHAMFLASYVGAPTVWQWTQLPGEVGCVMPSGVVQVGSTHLFISHDDIYMFDGARPLAIGGPVREWFFSDLNSQYAHRTVGVYNPLTGAVWWHYVSNQNASQVPDKALIYHVATRRFGVATLSVEAAAAYYNPGVTYDGLGSLYTTYDDLPTDLSYDSPYWSAARPDHAYFDTAHTLQTLSGTGVASSLLTGNFGDDDGFSTAQQVRPRYTIAPTSARLEHLYDDLYGDAFASLGKVSAHEGKFDVLWSSRWHRFRLEFEGNVEIGGMSLRAAPDGDA